MSNIWRIGHSFLLCSISYIDWSFLLRRLGLWMACVIKTVPEQYATFLLYIYFCVMQRFFVYTVNSCYGSYSLYIELIYGSYMIFWVLWWLALTLLGLDTFHSVRLLCFFMVYNCRYMARPSICYQLLASTHTAGPWQIWLFEFRKAFWYWANTSMLLRVIPVRDVHTWEDCLLLMWVFLEFSDIVFLLAVLV